MKGALFSIFSIFFVLFDVGPNNRFESKNKKYLVFFSIWSSMTASDRGLYILYFLFLFPYPALSEIFFSPLLVKYPSILNGATQSDNQFFRAIAC